MGCNNGVNDRLFKRHGRWVSESTKDCYVKDDIQERLGVFIQFGIAMK